MIIEGQDVSEILSFIYANYFHAFDDFVRDQDYITKEEALEYVCGNHDPCW